jgi:hypothetical protein
MSDKIFASISQFYPNNSGAIYPGVPDLFVMISPQYMAIPKSAILKFPSLLEYKIFSGLMSR